jgi:parallel beta-helix repeat protein
VIANHAEGTGDNGISITGYRNTVVGNICAYNYHSGIWLYGHMNSCSGNIVYNNGQRFLTDATDWSGIQLQSDFGGYSHFNSVTGNTVFDDQAVQTQIASLWVRNSYYGTWGPAKTITSTVGTYWTNGFNIYFSSAPAGSVTGATPPTHTSGTVSDGAVSWTYIDTFQVSATARGNHIATNYASAGRGSSEILVETAGNNTIFQSNVQEYTGWRSLAGDWVALAASRRYRRTSSVWATSQAIVYGDVRAGGNNIYRCINAGGTTSGTVPTHTSGTVTGADGIQWLFLYADLSQSHALVQFEQDGFRLMHREIIQAIDGTTFAYRMAGLGSPEGKVAAPVSSHFHRTDGAAGTCLYVKESGTGNTGWVAK